MTGVRLKASALFYAITVALLVAMIMGAMVLLTHYRNIGSLRWTVHERVASNARSGAYAGLHHAIPDAGPMLLDLFGEGTDSVQVELRTWGGLDLIFSTAEFADQAAWTLAVAGRTFSTQYVLDLGDGGGPLHLCGDARISGNIRVPLADVRRGYIEGRPFTGDRLVDGQIGRSLQDLVQLTPAFASRLKDAATGVSRWNERAVNLGEERSYDGTGQRAEDPVPVLELNGQVHLKGFHIKGPLIIRCNDSLTIDQDNELDLVILQAPFIVIDPGSRISVQCFASKGILVGENAELLFPSLLAVWRDEHLATAAQITIGEKALVQGAVIAVDRSIRDRQQGSLTIGPEAIIQGEVYAEGGVEHRGHIRGTLIAREFLLRTPASIYRGHLLDGTLDDYDLGRPIGFGCTETNEERIILEWRTMQHHEKES